VGVGRPRILRLIFGLGLARLMTSLLYGVKPLDPITFAAVAILVMTVAALASLIPRRAMAVDPVIAQRWD
jgi:putative ABC transport system permease protein